MTKKINLQIIIFVKVSTDVERSIAAVLVSEGHPQYVYFFLF